MESKKITYIADAGSLAIIAKNGGTLKLSNGYGDGWGSIIDISKRGELPKEADEVCYFESGTFKVMANDCAADYSWGGIVVEEPFAIYKVRHTNHPADFFIVRDSVLFNYED